MKRYVQFIVLGILIFVVTFAMVGCSDDKTTVLSATTTSYNDTDSDALGITDAFTNTTTDTLFTTAHMALSSDSAIPMYAYGYANSSSTVTHAIGTTTISNGALALGTYSQVVIGNKLPDTQTTSSDTSSNGVFDFSQGYYISFKVIATGGTTSCLFQIKIDDNTLKNNNGRWGASGLIVSAAVSSFTVGEKCEYHIAGSFSSTSFIQLLSRSSGTITIDDLIIEPY